MWGLVPWSGVKPEPPALGAWSLSHWTTREASPLALDLIDSIAKGCLLVDAPPTSMLCSLPWRQVLCFFCHLRVPRAQDTAWPSPRCSMRFFWMSGSPLSIWKRWQRMLSIAQNQGRKNTGLHVCFVWPACCWKNFQTGILRSIAHRKSRFPTSLKNQLVHQDSAQNSYTKL